LLINF